MAFLSIEGRQDSKHFKDPYTDDVKKTSMEGGYTTTRRRHTRSNLRKFTIGFTDISESEWNTLSAWFLTYGTHSIWEFTHPITLTTYNVRFEAPPMPTYVGRGGNHRRDVTGIILNEV